MSATAAVERRGCRSPAERQRRWHHHPLQPAARLRRDLFRLNHIARVDDERWAQFGPGAAGVGWDSGLIGLYLHLTTRQVVEPPRSTPAGPNPAQGLTSTAEWPRAPWFESACVPAAPRNASAAPWLIFSLRDKAPSA